MPDDDITSWEDIIDDPDFWDDVDLDDSTSEPSGEELDDLWERFGLVDANATARNGIRTIMDQPTHDFEAQYQAGYPVFRQAYATLDHESKRVDDAGSEFAPIVDSLRSDIDQQRQDVEALALEHAERHRKFRELTGPGSAVHTKMLEDSRDTAREIRALVKETDEDVLESFDEIRKGRVEAAEDANREWLRTFLK